MGAPLHCYTCVRGGDFLKVGVWERPNAIVVSWLRLQTASDGILHPYHMYTMCFSTLICWDRHMGALLHCNTCVGGSDILQNWGVGVAEWCCGVMVEASNSFRRLPTSISYVYKVVLHLDMLWMDRWVHPYTVILV